MNPIKIEIKLHTLEAINYSFQVLNSPSIANRESKAVRSVMVKISKKFQKKAIDKQGSTKLFKISLEYYEAHFLEQFLQACNVFPYSNTIQSVINILDQKLV